MLQRERQQIKRFLEITLDMFRNKICIDRFCLNIGNLRTVVTLDGRLAMVRFAVKNALTDFLNIKCCIIIYYVIYILPSCVFCF